MSTSKRHAVLIADVVGSRRIRDFRARRDRLLDRLSRQHVETFVVVPYTITSWDEFQTISSRPSHLPDIIWELRREFHPWQLKVGIGIGSLRRLPQPGEAVNEASMGEAFLRAREAMNEVTAAKEKYKTLTRLHADGGTIEHAINLIYDLFDTLVLGITERQWQTVQTYERAKKVEAAARQLGIDESTASRNLQRGFYWQTVAAREHLREMFSLYSNVQGARLVRGRAR